MGVDVLTFGCRLNAFESEVIRREADGAGIVRAFGLLQGAAEQRDAARRFPLGDGELAV